MKDWLKKNKEIFSNWKFKAGVAAFLLIMIVGIIAGPRFYGYAMAVIIFSLFYYFSRQAETERILSPKDIEQMQFDLNTLEEEAMFIREHIQENTSDLEAKLLLREIEAEIEQLKNAFPKTQEKK